MYIVSYTLSCVITTLATHSIILKLLKYIQLQVVIGIQNCNLNPIASLIINHLFFHNDKVPYVKCWVKIII